MYRINSDENTIEQVTKATFTDLGIQERKHLQEWLAKSPNVLGEDLLIIQKEFAGFDDTNERLDLLALDKNKNLVIIENKLDDSGRDVVWQALKYAGYCSNLDTKEVVKIFQDYLNKSGNGNAEELICNFLDADISEIQLNKAGSQRIILVAANYRKEVTNTMLWLMSQYGLDCQCFKVTPYYYQQDKFLTVERILPPVDSQAFMIGLAKKGIEDKITENEVTQAQIIRKEYWQYLLEELKKSDFRRFDNISPTTDQWINAGSGVAGMPYSLIFGKKAIRVEMTISPSEPEVNTVIFEYLFSKKEEIESVFSHKLEWLELVGKKSCRIQYSQNFDGYDKNNWGEISKWHIDNIVRFEKALSPHLKDAYDLMKQNEKLLNKV
ncbi:MULTISPECIES: DUF4268 domain-containing protein [unclassified Acinetobacter]|jgi:hypothetical protein|uniref:DUF4268 domain-containing protein n=1 Tax=unclassified Acinetobacter TaxID=196816 RepID=UPI0015D0D2C8|nr:MULTISPECIES: DUF4268 domain-containing protein [unclassified Acinetobacter]